MSARPIDGKLFAARVCNRVAEEVARLKQNHALVPGLAVVLAGDDQASSVYVRSKEKKAKEIGMNSFAYRLPERTTEDELLALIGRLNADPTVHGILVQLPLPDHLSGARAINAIDLDKDVDGFHVTNAGLLATGQVSMVPCTPLGCLMLLRDHPGNLSGRDAVVIGRSNIVGRPMAQLLIRENCTVTLAHSHTENLQQVVSRADIVIAAAGRAQMVTGDWIKQGATVIDVGINRIERDGKSKLVGDCHYESCARIAGAITPVPGGVGPMTIACLMANTLTTCCRINGLDDPEGLTA